jgi:hypothetical protein
MDDIRAGRKAVISVAITRSLTPPLYDKHLALGAFPLRGLRSVARCPEKRKGEREREEKNI